MDGLIPYLPLWPHHSRGDGTALAAEFRKAVSGDRLSSRFRWSGTWSRLPRIRTLLVLAGILLSSVDCVHAQTTAADFNKRGLAKSDKGDLDGAIADYTRAIELDPKYASAYHNRGIAKSDKGDLDGAIADYSGAIELDPKFSAPYQGRGKARRIKGDLDGAIVDYNRAIELDPKNVYAYTSRGTANELRRSWTDALVDYRRVCELDPKNDYPHLFIWLIRTRLGEQIAASEELGGWVEKRWHGLPGDWVVKVADFLRGQISEEELFTAARTPDPKKEQGQFCEAWFYAGMKHLFAGDKPTGIRYLHKSLATEMKDFTEYSLAQSELKALGETVSESQ